METQARLPQGPRSFLARFLAAIRNLSTHVSATAQLRPVDKFDTYQIQNASPSYGKCRNVEIEKAPGPLIRPGGQNACGSTQIVAIPATALAVLAELSDTKKPFSATKSLPLPRFIPSTWAKLSPSQSLPRTPVQWQPMPAPDSAPETRIPLAEPPSESLLPMSHCARIWPASTMSQFQKSVTSLRYEKMSHCDPIWPASTMSQMSHFSATKTRF